ncbi:hypothetical protein HS088_TW20G00647 [Tripterygium wilfordii]|uniref:Uncharacterized protein n=1 Tax=Tripterygium wilfordii TaxID=458696 RepID=A0A7J7C804_TRIWF|nr:hypothetical protein HS088_TW20G00647 [Tripterygium wilfordii]
MAARQTLVLLLNHIEISINEVLWHHCDLLEVTPSSACIWIVQRNTRIYMSSSSEPGYNAVPHIHRLQEAFAVKTVKLLSGVQRERGHQTIMNLAFRVQTGRKIRGVFCHSANFSSRHCALCAFYSCPPTLLLDHML